MTTSLTINYNATDLLLLRICLLGVLLFILQHSTPWLEVLETKLMSLDILHLHKGTYKLKPLGVTVDNFHTQWKNPTT